MTTPWGQRIAPTIDTLADISIWHATVDLDMGKRSILQTERIVAKIFARRAVGEDVGWIEASPPTRPTRSLIAHSIGLA